MKINHKRKIYRVKELYFSFQMNIYHLFIKSKNIWNKKQKVNFIFYVTSKRIIFKPEK